MTAHLLLLDGDAMTAGMLRFLLGDTGYQTTILADPRRVDGFLEENAADLILLDATLPHVDGFALCATVRREHPDIPVIFLSARNMVSDKIAGFEHGADDYLAKPFEPTELLARVQAVLRRYSRTERNHFGSSIRSEGAALDLGAMQFTAPARRPVPLTPTEMKILECLMRDADAVVLHETLIERTWGYDYEGESNRVQVYISRLRKKIEEDPGNPMYLHTVRDAGYTFRPGRAAARPALHLLDAGRGDAGENGRAREWSAIGD